MDVLEGLNVLITISGTCTVASSMQNTLTGINVALETLSWLQLAALAQLLYLTCPIQWSRQKQTNQSVIWPPAFAHIAKYVTTV